MRSKKTKNLALFAFFLAVELILLFTPLGFLRIGPLSATLMHIPVIIAAITMGWKYGCALGLVFGLCSVWSATFTPGPTSFCFSPFITVGSFSGNFSSLIIAIVPRILIAVSAYGVYTLCEKKKISSGIGIPLAAAAGSITNTALVLGLIYLFFGPSYASAVNIAYETLLGVLLGVVATNGISETIVGCIVVLMVTKALKQIMK
ncbi:MAG: ECF transporter S component [Erysipelotrichaceae bacterium]|nr:ECF transporter S component [Erysipelotrichaceae bacterium]MCI9524251.1 ECF transporter S component [Erysipelotrichaceae bacterium]